MTPGYDDDAARRGRGLPVQTLPVRGRARASIQRLNSDQVAQVWCAVIHTVLKIRNTACLPLSGAALGRGDPPSAVVRTTQLNPGLRRGPHPRRNSSSTTGVDHCAASPGPRPSIWCRPNRTREVQRMAHTATGTKGFGTGTAALWPHRSERRHTIRSPQTGDPEVSKTWMCSSLLARRSSVEPGSAVRRQARAAATIY
jgi:hypothetical protein